MYLGVVGVLGGVFQKNENFHPNFFVIFYIYLPNHYELIDQTKTDIYPPIRGYIKISTILVGLNRASGRSIFMGRVTPKIF